MAGLIGLTADDIVIQDALGAIRWAYEGEWIPHPVVRLTTTLPVAVNAKDGEREVVRARWGFNVGSGRPIGNARDDKLNVSRMWSSMLGKTPCLFASTGIYEMIKDSEGNKQSYWFRRTDQKPIVMPGLSGVRNVKDSAVLCGAIVTTEPNAFFKQYHNRQVCTLTPKEADVWMTETDPDELMALLHAPTNDEWEAVPVADRIFQKGRVEMEHLVETGEPERWGEPRPAAKASGPNQTLEGF